MKRQTNILHEKLASWYRKPVLIIPNPPKPDKYEWTMKDEKSFKLGEKQGRLSERNKIIDFLRDDVEDGDTIADIIEARCK